MSISDSSLISIIVPVFNEEAGIDYLSVRLAAVRKLWPDRPVEFIFVDDGSSDETIAALRRVFANRPECAIVCHENNRGVGAAFRTGFGRAKGDILCTIDADCSYGPENLRLLVDALEREGADIAVASPYHPDAGVENVPRWRLMLSRGCSQLYRWTSPVRLYTYTSVFRAYRRRVFERVEFAEDGFVSAVEILIRAAEQNFRITEVPMTLQARKFGTSKMKVLRTIRQHLSMLRKSATRRLSLTSPPQRRSDGSGA
jgi:dolichol-phosphate mannosyltransferase